MKGKVKRAGARLEKFCLTLGGMAIAVCDYVQ
jgi:hypothetical protein